MKALRKIMALTIAAGTITAVGVTAGAAEFEGSANVSGYLFEMVEWQKLATDPVVVDHYGTYTVSADGLSVPVDMIGSFYLKDYDFETNESMEDSNLPKDIIINTKSIKVNGNEYTPAEGYATTNESGKFEVCYVNYWGDSFLDLSAEGTVNSFEITFEVAPADGLSYEDPVAADVEDTSVVEIPADDNTETSSDSKGSPDTGVEGVAAFGGVAAAAAAVLFISRKRK